MRPFRLNFRRYEPSDFEALHALDRACFPKSIAYDRSELRGYLGAPNAYCVVAMADTVVAGYVLTDRSAEFGHIITLDVLPAFRRISIGSQLLGSAEREAASHGVAIMYLETATSNKPAIALWKKHGYREVGTIQDYYGQGLDAFEMQKLLRPS